MRILQWFVATMIAATCLSCTRVDEPNPSTPASSQEESWGECYMRQCSARRCNIACSDHGGDEECDVCVLLDRQCSDDCAVHR